MTAATATPPRGGEVAADVLARAKAGDQRAFTELVRHYDHRLRALAYRLLGTGRPWTTPSRRPT